ncbi:MAG: PEP-CTERM sorting domain-containing protein, partial [Verrucomicrobiaceae bacterium]
LVNGALGSAVTVANGAKLGGTGTVGAVTVNSGGTVGGGNSIGTLAASSAVINGTLDVEFDGTGAGTVDLLAVTGNLDITNAIVDFSLIGAPADDAAYVFASYGTLTGTIFASITGDLPAGYHIDYAFNNGVTSTNIALVVPEPGAMLLGGLSLLGLLRRRR